ncbi:hypothetical protein [Paraburkholderia bannensis]|uniref:hypothetical protein n=1 Tax=Paraburkholderia bannensis TaxID=765414 RepID=UPI002AB30D53|nr:hypothetical protein [Paraburkholderia bannensis]
MFVTSEFNRMPVSNVPFGGLPGKEVWSAVQQLLPRDVLILRVSEPRSRAVPTIVMLDLRETAATLEQFVGGNVILRGAAVLSTKMAREVEQWTLDPVSEIRLGVTEPEQYSVGKPRLVTVTRFTTAAGRTLSVPYALATKASRGRRLWRAKVSTAAARA